MKADQTARTASSRPSALDHDIGVASVGTEGAPSVAAVRHEVDAERRLVVIGWNGRSRFR